MRQRWWGRKAWWFLLLCFSENGSVPLIYMYIGCPCFWSLKRELLFEFPYYLEHFSFVHSQTALLLKILFNLFSVSLCGKLKCNICNMIYKILLIGAMMLVIDRDICVCLFIYWFILEMLLMCIIPCKLYENCLCPHRSAEVNLINDIKTMDSLNYICSLI